MADMIRQLATEQAIPAGYGNSGEYHLMKFNERLDADRRRPLNENDFDDMLAALPADAHTAPALWHLTLERVAELAVVTAGTYVDSGHFTTAGDLLFNPRRVDVYVNGETIPIRKERHTRLSDQLAPMLNGADPIPWLSQNTMIRIRRKALLPHLREMLEPFGELSKPYLRHFDRRLCKAADTLSFLMSWQIFDSEALGQRMQTASSSQKQFINKNLCRFGWGTFHELGNKIARTTVDIPEDYSRIPAGADCAESGLFFGDALCQC